MAMGIIFYKAYAFQSPLGFSILNYAHFSICTSSMGTQYILYGSDVLVKTKGQIISKGLLVSTNSPKIRTNKFVFTTTMNSFVRFFGRIRGHQKVLSKLSDL